MTTAQKATLVVAQKTTVVAGQKATVFPAQKTILGVVLGYPTTQIDLSLPFLSSY